MGNMGLQRRTFLGLITGFAGAILRVPRGYGWLSRSRESAREEDAEPLGQTSATRAGDASGIKITTIRRTTFRDSTQDLSHDPQVFYIQGEWRRWERPRTYSGIARADGSSQRIYGPRIVTIVRPDLATVFDLNMDASDYVVTSYPPKKPQALTIKQLEAHGIRIPSPAASTKPTFQIETTTKDTGERKEVLGYLARHVITTRREIPLEGSRRSAQETVTDGWYIDLETRLYPTIYAQELADLKSRQQNGPVHNYVTAGPPGAGDPPEVPEFIDIGEPETGFAVQEIRTSRSSYTLPDGSTKQTEGKFEKAVTLEKGIFDTMLFEVPSSFRRVDHIDQNPKRG
jgi:hypothetical protein